MPQLAIGVAGAFTAFQASALGVFLTQTFLGRLLTTVALSALSAALTPSPKPAGITTEFTSTGSTTPLSFVLGRTATAGDMVCPPMSHGTAGKTPNAYLTYVISLGDMAGLDLVNYYIDGKEAPWDELTPHADYGWPVLGDFEGYAWIKVYDGTQTAADPMLLAKYGSYPERPWTADMIGEGVPYAILTFRYSTEVFQGLPEVLFDIRGPRLYDPRLDTTVGGSGTHLWADPSTWDVTVNPVVMAYNIARGITLPDFGTWGGEVEAADLPLTTWFAAMNECDVDVTLAGGGTEKAYRAGIEVRVDRSPAEVLEELMKACSGQMADIGGVWKIRVGGPDLPVYVFDDDDIVVTRAQDLDPFPGFDQRYNAITAEYPDPASVWQPVPATPLYNATWEAEDGNRRLVADLALPAVYSQTQAQRLMTFAIQEERRFRRHRLTLPPDAAILEPLDAVSWTSTRNGYTAKVFEVGEVADDPARLLQGLALRERDAADYTWTPPMERPWQTPSAVFIRPVGFQMPGFALRAVVVSDGSTGRRPAVRFAWDAEGLDGVTGVRWELRLLDAGLDERYSTNTGGATLILDFRNEIYAQDLNGKFWDADGASLVLDFRRGRYGRDNDWRDPLLLRPTLRGEAAPGTGEVTVTEAILQGVTYEGRILPVADFPVSWTDWLPVVWPSTPVYS